MAINLASVFLTPNTIKFILNTSLLSELTDVLRAPVLIKLIGESVLMMVTFGIAISLFSIVWFFEDANIIFSNKHTSKINNMPFILKSMGDWFETIFKSFAGLGAIISYILIIYDFLDIFLANLNKPSNIWNIPSLVLWLGLPFYLIFATIPSILINDIIKEHRIKYIKNSGKHLGITDDALIDLEFKKNE